MAPKSVKKVRGIYERDPGSGIWWICYKQGSVRKREKVGRRSDAIALYQQRKTELRSGAKLAKNLRTRAVTFGDLAKDALSWSEEHRPKGIRTLRGRMKVVVARFGTLLAEDVTPQVIDSWITDHDGWTPATKNRYRATMSLVYRQGMRNDRIAVNPARLVAPRAENNGRIRYLSDEEEGRLRRVLNVRYKSQVPALDVALNTGMRKSEQFSLTWSAIDFKRREITLEETKNGSSRVVPINSNCATAFRTLLKRARQLKMTSTSDRVFLSTRDEPLENPRSWFEEALKESKIRDLRWHDLRHTFCSRLAMSGIDIRTIAALAGHKTLAMAMRYSHLAPSHNLKAVEALVRR